MNKYLAFIVTTTFALTGCMHGAGNTNTTPVAPVYPSIDGRKSVAANTCDAQYKKERQNYLSAVQTVIASGSALPDATNAPLDQFRAEVNAAYNTVVMRCKTHMHCLEFQRYNEAACYMSASDRKDAERRFADLSEDLRRIEREGKKHEHHGKKKKSGKPSVNVTVTQSNDQSQTNDNHNGNRIEDQDVLVLCGDARNLLEQRCRDRCDNC